MMWYSRFQVLWSIFKAEYPSGTLQQAYDEKTIEDGTLTPNPLHCAPLKWALEHLCDMAGVPIDNAGLDTIYAILIDYRETGMSVFDHLWVNHPEIKLKNNDSEPLPDRIGEATVLLSQLLGAGHDASNIQYCLEALPYRELISALKLQAQAVERMQAESPKSSSPSREDKNEMAELEKLWNSPEIKAEMDQMKTSHLMRTKLQREFSED